MLVGDQGLLAGVLLQGHLAEQTHCKFTACIPLMQLIVVTHLCAAKEATDKPIRTTGVLPEHRNGGNAV